jgi:hypothetical protein
VLTHPCACVCLCVCLYVYEGCVRAYKCLGRYYMRRLKNIIIFFFCCVAWKCLGRCYMRRQRKKEKVNSVALRVHTR